MNKNIFMQTKTRIIPPAWRLMLALILCVAFLPVQMVKAAEAAPTSVQISSIIPSPAYIDQQVTIYVQAAAVNGLDGIPTGNVEIRSGQNRVCFFALDSAGEGNCHLSFTTPATVPLKAVYLGTNNFLPSVSTEINLIVKNKHTPTVDIQSDIPDPSIIDRLVNVAVNVTSDGPIPTGNLNVWRSDVSCKAPPASTAVDQCSTSLTSGAGSCSLALTASGDVHLCAAYGGDTYTFPAQAVPEVHRVSGSNTFTIITKIDPEPSLLGEAVWVYYKVSSPDGEPAPTDLVKVTSRQLTCTATVSDGRCALTFTTPHLHDVIAEYQGHTMQNLTVSIPIDLDPSTSDVVVHRVNAAPIDISLSSNRVNVFSAAGKEIAEITAIDPNPDETHVFSLVPGEGSGDNSLFKISGAKLLMNGTVPQNRSSLSIRIRVTDSAGLTFEKNFTLRVTSDAVLPQTGFAHSRETNLLPQPREKGYQGMGQINLEIPSLGVQANITGVPYIDGWDTSWLWNQAGWLNGTAFPGWQGNAVLAAHNYLPNGEPGPFSQLQNLHWGDRVLVHAFGQTLVYEVRTVETVSPQQTAMIRHEDSPWLTLVTCKSFDEISGTYRWRVVVRAILIEIQ